MTRLVSLVSSNLQGFLCVFSLVERGTFEHMDDFREQIMRVHEDKKMPIILIGNKSDMTAERQVSLEEAEAKAASVSSCHRGAVLCL
jgi:GTPase SAR1 family protein